MMALQGADYAARCNATNLGILAARFKVDSAKVAAEKIKARGWMITRPLSESATLGLGSAKLFSIKTPDGAIIQFYSEV